MIATYRFAIRDYSVRWEFVVVFIISQLTKYDLAFLSAEDSLLIDWFLVPPPT